MEILPIWNQNIPGYDPEMCDEIPGLIPYLLESEKPSAVVVIFPGGGYQLRSERVKEPIARWLNSIGLSAFVLEYRLAPYRHPYPFMDASRAIRHIRYNAEKYNIDPGRIGIIGFSAGGHLAAAVGTCFDNGNPLDPDPVERVSSRPDLLILSYPVISFGPFGHEGSFRNLTGEIENEELRTALSMESRVSAHTPPVFLWHTAEDDVVVVENSLLFAQALSRHKVPYSFHVFPHGGHGLGLAREIPLARAWTGLCQEWLRENDFIDCRISTGEAING